MQVLLLVLKNIIFKRLTLMPIKTIILLPIRRHWIFASYWLIPIPTAIWLHGNDIILLKWIPIGFTEKQQWRTNMS